MNGAAMQARSYADKATPTEVSSILEQRIRGVQEEAGLAETGRVLSVGYVEFENTDGQSRRRTNSGAPSQRQPSHPIRRRKNMGMELED